MRRAIICLICFLMPMLSSATEYRVIKDKSSLTFAGEHAGDAFQGTFQNWNAAILFDPDNLAESSVVVDIDMSSAVTGNGMYDGTLPTADWFDVKRHPQAQFVSSSITRHADGGYQMEGALTLRDITQPVSFLFTLEKGEQSAEVAKARFAVDRLAYHIGKASDPAAEWVSREIALELLVYAEPKQ